jgi:prolyl 4-hydroxylase
MRTTRLSLDPRIYTIDDVLTDVECTRLIALARPLLRTSLTVHADGSSKPSRTRTSSSAYISHAQVPWLIERVGRFLGVDEAHVEPPQITRYERGQRYDAHHDGVDPRGTDGQSFVRDRGQRVVTLLFYLNDVRRGGATRFQRLRIDVRPRVGQLLVFYPSRDDLHQIDERLLHSAEPAEDTKWVCQIWVRARAAPS